MATFIQANLNRSREAQDLMLQHAIELRASLCVVSEPARLPVTQQWYLSLNGLAAIYINDRDTISSVNLISKSDNFVVIRYNDLHIISVYISPNVSIAEYSAFLDDLTSVCVQLTRSVVIGGDFNAHAVSWGSPSTDSRHLV